MPPGGTIVPITRERGFQQNGILKLVSQQFNQIVKGHEPVLLGTSQKISHHVATGFV